MNTKSGWLDLNLFSDTAELRLRFGNDYWRRKEFLSLGQTLEHPSRLLVDLHSANQQIGGWFIIRLLNQWENILASLDEGRLILDQI